MKIETKVLLLTPMPIFFIMICAAIYRVFGGQLNPHGNGILVFLLLLILFLLGSIVATYFSFTLLSKIKKNSIVMSKIDYIALFVGIVFSFALSVVLANFFVLKFL